MSSSKYGEAPVDLGVYDPKFVEYMTYQYLPIRVEGQFHIPQNLWFAWGIIDAAIAYENTHGRSDWKYVYLTAKRGFATPGNPLNRPGWHADGFGTTDVNYVWVDKYPTVFATGNFGVISDDHIKSAKQFEYVVDHFEEEGWDITLSTYPDKTLLRLDDTVIHAAPEIPEPGGERSFLKVSFSDDKYNLLGNAHNYGIKYDWEMFPRDFVRNDPAKAGKDSA